MEVKEGVLFWSAMYIPIVVAMASIQNVKAAVSRGSVALLAGLHATLVGFLLIPVISNFSSKNQA